MQALSQGRRSAISTWREWGGGWVAALENPLQRREFVREGGGGGGLEARNWYFQHSQ